MRASVIFFAALFVVSVSKSQTSPVTDVTDKINWRIGVSNFTKLSNGEFLSVAYEGKPKIKLYGIGNNYYSGNFVVRRFSAGLKEIQSTTIKLEDVNAEIQLMHLVVLNKRIYFLYGKKSGDRAITDVWGTELDTTSLSVVREIKLSSFEFGKNHKISISTSPGKQFALFRFRSYNKGNEVYELFTVDADLKRMRTISYELGESEFLHDAAVNDNGNVYVVMRNKVDDDVQYYSLQLYAENKKTPSKKVKIDFSGKYPNNYNLYYNNISGKYFLTGTYQNSYGKNITGVYFADISNLIKSSVRPVLKDIDASVLSGLDEDGIAKKGGKNTGLDQAFAPTKILARKDGSIDVILEYNKSIRGEKAAFYNSGSIVDIHYTDGQINFIRIPKMQSYANSNAYLSNYAFICNNNLVVLYNEREDNLAKPLEKAPSVMGTPKNSMLVAAVINSDNTLERRVIRNNGDGRYASEPLSFVGLENNKIMLIQSKVDINNFSYRMAILDAEKL